MFTFGVNYFSIKSESTKFMDQEDLVIMVTFTSMENHPVPLM